MSKLMHTFYYDADKWVMEKVLASLEAMRVIRICHSEKTSEVEIEYIGQRRKEGTGNEPVK